MNFYGFKLHIQLTDQEWIMSYVVAPASYHDVVVEEVIEQFPYPFTLADKEFISEPLKEKLKKKYGVYL
jgi:Transposase DDE domain